MTVKMQAIAESDKRWPDYGDLESHSLSGGFIDGAVWRSENSMELLEQKISELFPPVDDEIEALVMGRWERGFRLGAQWVNQGGITTQEPLGLFE